MKIREDKNITILYECNIFDFDIEKQKCKAVLQCNHSTWKWCTFSTSLTVKVSMATIMYY